MSEYSVEEILRAKRIAKEAGYEVTLPTDRVEQAMNIARANGYNVRKAEEAPATPAAPAAQPAATPAAAPAQDPTEVAIQVAKQAGYNVIPPENNPNLPGAARTTPTPAPAAAPAPAPKKEEDPYAGYSWSERQAAKYL